MLSRPRSSFTAMSDTPRITRCDANVCRNSHAASNTLAEGRAAPRSSGRDLPRYANHGILRRTCIRRSRASSGSEAAGRISGHFLKTCDWSWVTRSTWPRLAASTQTRSRFEASGGGWRTRGGGRLRRRHVPGGLHGQAARGCLRPSCVPEEVEEGEGDAPAAPGAREAMAPARGRDPRGDGQGGRRIE